MLLVGRALIGLGVASAMTAGLKALVLWFPGDRVPLLNGLMVMLGALGAVTATLPADLLLDWIGWRELFGLFAGLTAASAVIIYLIVPEATPVASGAVSVGLRKIYADPRFWRLAPLSASCIGTAWALQGLWAAQWLKDVEGLDRAGVVFHLFAMAVALSLGAILLGVAADRLRRRGVGPEVLLGLVAAVFIATQFALILRLPLPSYLQWAVVAAVGAATVLSFAILAEYFPKQLAGRANGALNLFHIAAAFAVQYTTGVVLQHWTPEAGHYPEIAYQTAFALNLVLQIVAWIWFALPWAFLPTSDDMPPASVRIIACRRARWRSGSRRREYVDPNLCVPDGPAPLHAAIDWHQSGSNKSKKRVVEDACGHSSSPKRASLQSERLFREMFAKTT